MAIQENRQEVPLFPNEDWECVMLGDVCEIERGITFPASEKASKGLPDTIACLRTANVQKEVDWDDLIYVPIRYVNSSHKLLHQNDILISMANSLELVGKVAFVPYLPEKATFGGFISAIRANDRINPRYLFFCIRKNSIQEEIRSTANRSVNIANLSLAKIKTIKIPLPSLDEQEHIIEVLESILSKIHTARAALERISPLLKAFRQSVLATAFRGELTERDPNDEPAEALLERIRAERRRKWEENLRAKGKDPAKFAYEEAVAPDTSNLPGLPEGWAWVRVSDIAEVRLGRQRSPSRSVGPNMCLYIRAANITWDGLDVSDVMQMDFSPEEQKVYNLQDGDVLLNEASGSVSEVGKPALWKNEIPGCCFQNTIIRVRPQGPLPDYLYFHFYYDAVTVRFSQSTQGIGINHLGAKGLSEWVIALAPIEEQKRIVDKLRRSFENIEIIKNTNVISRQRLDELEQAALSKAFRGEL